MATSKKTPPKAQAEAQKTTDKPAERLDITDKVLGAVREMRRYYADSNMVVWLPHNATAAVPEGVLVRRSPDLPPGTVYIMPRTAADDEADE